MAINPLVELDELGDLVRQMHKIDSKMHAGQFIDAHREIHRIIAEMEEAKKTLVGSATPIQGNDNE